MHVLNRKMGKRLVRVVKLDAVNIEDTEDTEGTGEGRDARTCICVYGECI